MQLYEVSNGWVGEYYVRVVVVAPDEQTARRMAGLAFREANAKYTEPDDKLEVLLCCSDLTRVWVSKPNDSGIGSQG